MESSSTQPRPNIVVILVDDMGYSDIGCYGSEIRTPHIDGMARNGIRFSQMYNCARCCPSRAALLTGLYPHRAGVGAMVNDLGLGPSYQGFLRDDCVTIAEVLRSGGYRTLMSGKWHVGGNFPRNSPADWQIGDPRRPLPPDRGFDEWYGTPAGAGSYFNPKPLFRNHTIIEPDTDDYYYTDAVTTEACRMIREAPSQNPFFLYVAYTAPHWPLHARPEDVARYETVYRQGWENVRASRHDALRSLHILSKKWTISPPDNEAASGSGSGNPDWESLRMAVYAAQVDRMDQGVGRILAELRARAIEDNTLVIFLSDNGGCHELLSERVGEREWSQTRAGQPVHFGNRPELSPGGPDTYQSYGRSWACASNSPFRMYKHWVHEGGISTPLVVQWPARIRQSSIVHATCHITDTMPTCLETAGLRQPSEYRGRRVSPLDGESFLPLLAGCPWTRTRPLFWEHEGHRALRDGIWKLVSQWPQDWELYNMEADRTETVNLADREPERRRQMIRAHDEWAAELGIVAGPPWKIRRTPK